MEYWRAQAACRGCPPEWFFEETEAGEANHGKEAKAVCSTCEVTVECLDYAIRNNEQYGIWGGTGFDLRTRVRQVYRAGDPIEYKRALNEEVETLARIFNGMPDERPVEDEQQCSRCDSVVPAGRHPTDRNGPAATCGKASTYNRGCRCVACVEAKAEYHRRPKKPKGKPKRKSPRGDRSGKVVGQSSPTESR